MTEIQFTPSQMRAIHEKNKTLIVSAGAGSGKTTVLTRRLLRLLTEGADINDFLVVTFTNAAASSLKDKLYALLLAESAKNPGDKRLIRALYALPSAKISTIHSFCLELIKANFAALSLAPTLRIVDEAEGEILLENTLEELIDEGFEKEDPDFLTLCDAFSGEKNLDAFKSTVIQVYKKYRAFPFWEDLARQSGKSELEMAETAGKRAFSPPGKGRHF